MTLKWIPPVTPNGVVMKYSIQYGEIMIDNFGSTTLVKMIGTVEGLSPDTQYVLQLRAHTRVGPGPPTILTVETSKLYLWQYKYNKRLLK